PSIALRRWYQHDPEKWGEFRLRYVAELRQNPAVGELRAAIAASKSVTLLFAARDLVHNNAVVLRDFLRADELEPGGLLSLAQGRPESAPVRAAKNVEWNGAIDLFRVKQADEIIGARDFCAIDGKQNIAAEQTSVIGRASRFHRAHHGSKSLCEAKA